MKTPATMTAKSDGEPQLLPGPRTSDAALARVRATALAELKAQGPSVPWDRRARNLAASVGVITLVGALVVVAINWPPSNLMVGRVPAIFVLGLSQIVGLLAAFSPRRSKLVPLSWALAAAGILTVLAGRQGAAPTEGASEFVCSISHIATGAIPLWLVVRALQDSAFDWRRTLTAGLALGVSAPLWGEVVCERDREHVVVHHLGGLLVLALVLLLISRRMRRRSFAP